MYFCNLKYFVNETVYTQTHIPVIKIHMYLNLLT